MPRPPHTMIWGIHPVTEALRKNPDRIEELTVQQSSRSDKISEIIQLARKNHISVCRTSKIIIRGEEDVNHQGVAAKMKAFRFSKLDTILEQTPPPRLLVILDSIQDPHNLGAIIRSAAAARCGGLIIPKDRSAQISGTVAKVAAGALSHINICQVTNLSDTIKRLKEHNYWIFGADGHTEQTIYQTDFSGQCCLVIGSEGKGLRSLVKKNCDQLVKIPMAGGIESLNASVAASVIIFEIVRQQINY